ncbi:MAG: ACP S-malonyltransferase [Gammaproteobacteria bacterium]
MNIQAIVFPGQGSQAVGMQADIAAEYPIVKQTFAEASKQLGYDLWELVQTGPAEKLNSTVHTQPAILTASIAIWRIINEKHALKPEFLAGHSLGEYSALVAAGAIEFPDAVKLVAARGKFMQEAIAVGVGAMAAIVGLSAAQVIEICDQAGQQEMVEAVNFNAPDQVVIAGHAPAVDRACIMAKAQGAKLAIVLPVSVPAHSELMEPAAERLAELLKTVSIQKPNFPVINNVDVAIVYEPDAIRDALARQLHSPVRWVETIEKMANSNVQTILECGPGRVLSGLIKRIAPNINCQTTHDKAALAAL